MGASGKWLKSLIGGKKSSNTTLAGKNTKKSPNQKSKRWVFWKLSNVESKGLAASENKEAEHALTIATASAMPTEAIVGATTGVSGVNTNVAPSGITYKYMREEWAAICIQTAFRGFLARRTLRTLKGIVRLQALVRGHVVRKQAAATLHCMQALVRVQARVRAHRVRMSQEGKSIQQKINEKRKLEAQVRECEEGWCDSIGTVEDMQAKVQQRQEAAIKRERAMAYAFSNQWQANSRSNPQSFMEFEPDKTTWGWIWLERWMAARPWESDQKPKNVSGNDSVKSPNDVSADKKKPMNMQQEVKVKKAVNSRVFADVSKIGHKQPTRVGSHGNIDVPNISGYHSDTSPSNTSKGTPKSNGGQKHLPIGTQERRAYSNPKQRPSNDHPQAKKRLSLPNPDVRSAAVHKLHSIPKPGKASN